MNKILTLDARSDALDEKAVGWDIPMKNAILQANLNNDAVANTFWAAKLPGAELRAFMGNKRTRIGATSDHSGAPALVRLG